MWKINEVLQVEQDLYRVLAREDAEVIWIRLTDPKALPTVVLDEQLRNLIDQEKMTRVADPYQYLALENPKPETAAYKKREKAAEAINAIVYDSKCFDETERGRRISKAIALTGYTKPSIYRLLKRYWQRGQTANALLPDYKNSGAPGKSRPGTGKKVGRKRKYSDSGGAVVTEEIARLFRIIIDRHLLNDRSLHITYAYRRFALLYCQYYPDTVEGDIPTYRQFDYFYRREYQAVERLVARTLKGEYQKDVRPLHGTSTAGAIGPGSRYEIDATIADIYLVSDDDPSKIIGRPTIYVVVDVFSRMVAGLYIGFDNPSYATAMQALVNAFEDKVEFCKAHGLDISSEDWPCVGLPDAILADRGELLGNQIESLTKNFNVRIENTAPRRGDAKGIVERNFRTIQAEFKPFAPGVVSGNRVKKHGEKDYRTSAAMGKSDFIQVVIRSVITRNRSKVIKDYDRDADIPPNVPPIPIELWRWGVEHRVGKLRASNSDYLKVMLLPRAKVTLSPKGINLGGVFYSCSEVLEKGWLHRDKKITRPKGLEAAYDPGLADHIYLFPEEGGRPYWLCNLTQRSRQFANLTYWQVWQIQREQKKTEANARTFEAQERRDLDVFIQGKIKQVEKEARSKPRESDTERVRAIRTNKREAREQEKLQRAYRPSTVKQEKPAQVIRIKEEQDDYRYPSLISELHSDDVSD